MTSIRKAVPADAAGIAGVLRTSFDHTYPNFPVLHTPEEDLAFISDTILLKDEVYVAEDAGKIVGFIAFNSEWIDHLYLLPEAQRQGIGTQLLDLALAYSDHLRLWTFVQNHGARAFYRKHGFIAILETDGAGNDEKQPDILFERKV